MNNEKFMKILITSPSGAIGRRILPELLAPEFSIRVITRHPGQLPSDIRDQVEVVQGTTDNATTLRQALDGVDALLWCLAGESLHESNFRGRHERFAQAASQAIRRSQTPRVVHISIIDQLPACSSISVWSTTEEILNETGAAIRHLRCSWPIEDMSQSAANIADLALKLLVRRDWRGIQALSVGSKQAYEFMSTSGSDCSDYSSLLINTGL